MLGLIFTLHSQENNVTHHITLDSSKNSLIQDSTKHTKIDSINIIVNKIVQDSLKKLSTKDTSKFKKSKSGIDSVIIYSAKDSVIFNFKNKTLRLRGHAKLDYKAQTLESEVIQFNFNNSIITSEGAADTTGKVKGYPKFKDQNDIYYGKKISYNFKNQQGVIDKGETQIDQGFYYGSTIKRVSETEGFIKDGCYTTCDATHPHYYFGSPEMKVILQDRVFLDPILFYVEDMPIFLLPVGLYFPNKSGRQSGLIIPSFFFSRNRGVALENLGLFLALSDYYDTQFLLDFYSKGGYTMKNNTRWVLTDVFNGNMNFQYGRSRFNYDEDYTTNWSLDLVHNHNINPSTKIVTNVHFMSQGFNKNTSFNLDDRIKQSISSNASFSQNYDDGSSLSASYSRDQNIISNLYSHGMRVSYNVPQINPLQSVLSNALWIPDWIKDLAFTYNVNSTWNETRTEQITPRYIGLDSLVYDTLRFIINRKITHSPSISISPKFGYFNVSPFISFNAANYFRRLKRYYNLTDSTTKNTFQSGFFTEYNYNVGVNFSTRLFGILRPKLFGINAVRHTFQPSIGYSYSPDLSSPKYGLYDSYYDPRIKQSVVYSRYEADGGGFASRSLSQSLNYSFLNSLEAKIKQGDTIEDKNIELLRLTANGNYNFMADSLRFSDISMSFHTPNIVDISFNGGATFTLYDEAPLRDPVTGNLTNYYTRINKFLASQNKGIARITSFNLQLATSFSSKSLNTSAAPTNQNNILSIDSSKIAKKDSNELGDRFQKRMEGEQSKRDFFGENNPGWSPLSIPWNASLGFSCQYSQPFVHQVTRAITMNLSASFELTQTWHFDCRGDYDFVTKQLMTPSISIRKDMHCWELNFQWYPIGYSAGFYLRFAIKAPQLQDLKYELRNSPLLR
jgi:hypothetical protein